MSLCTRQIIYSLPQSHRCLHIKTHCEYDFLNYYSLHFCTFNSNSFLTIPTYLFLLIILFYLLSDTSNSFLSTSLTKLVDHLHINQNLAAVTLLALGNGASDVISSLVASTDTDGVEFSIGALIGSGVFVTSFVLGLVVYYGNGIKVNAMMFNRDILLYLLSLLMLVVIGVRGRISYVESLCFLSVYVVNVALAFVQDRQMKTKDKEGDIEEGIELVESEDGVLKEEGSKDSEDDDVFRERGNVLPLKVITEMKSDQLGK